MNLNRSNLYNTFTIKLTKDKKGGMWVLSSTSPLTFGSTTYLPLCPYSYLASGDAYPKKNPGHYGIFVYLSSALY